MSPEKSLRHSSLEDREKDRDKIFHKLFSQEAKEGFDIEYAEGVRHIPGWYEQFPDLSKVRIDGIVEKNKKRATEAKKIGYVGSILEGDLRRESVREKIKKDIEDNKKRKLKDHKKELKHVEKGLGYFKKDVYP